LCDRWMKQSAMRQSAAPIHTHLHNTQTPCAIYTKLHKEKCKRP